VKVTADAGAGRRVQFVTDDPPSAEDWRRWKALAAMPGLADAVWTGEPGESTVPVQEPPIKAKVPS
jgi:hypothetical protein